MGAGEQFAEKAQGAMFGGPLADHLSWLVCSECEHLILRFHTAYDCDYHNTCDCTMALASALAVELGGRVFPPGRPA